MFRVAGAAHVAVRSVSATRTGHGAFNDTSILAMRHRKSKPIMCETYDLRASGSRFANRYDGGSMPVAVDMLNATLDRLADYESGDSVVSLYLDLKPEQPAQSYKAFLADAEKEFPDAASAFEKIRSTTWKPRTPPRRRSPFFHRMMRRCSRQCRSMFRSVVTVCTSTTSHTSFRSNGWPTNSRVTRHCSSTRMQPGSTC